MPGLFDLAVELRVQVYRDILDNVTGVQQDVKCCHYLMKLPKLRFKNYVNILCANSKVKAELRPVVEDDYIPDLFRFLRGMRKSCPHLKDFKLGLRYYVYTNRQDHLHRRMILRKKHFALVGENYFLARCCPRMSDIMKRPVIDYGAHSHDATSKLACPHGNTIEMSHVPNYPSLRRYIYRLPPKSGAGIVVTIYMDYMGSIDSGPFRASVWIEGIVNDIDEKQFTRLSGREEPRCKIGKESCCKSGFCEVYDVLFISSKTIAMHGRLE